jgi:predicted DNA-binding transcriptional regulator AlpA
MEEAKPRILPGDAVIKFANCARVKFDHSTRWLWGKIKTPGFPQPIYIEGSPHFIVREIDEYLSRCAGEKVAA